MLKHRSFLVCLQKIRAGFLAMDKSLCITHPIYTKYITNSLLLFPCTNLHTYIYHLVVFLKNIHQQVGERQGEIKQINYREKEYFKPLPIRRAVQSRAGKDPRAAQISWTWAGTANRERNPLSIPVSPSPRKTERKNFPRTCLFDWKVIIYSETSVWCLSAGFFSKNLWHSTSGKIGCFMNSLNWGIGYHVVHCFFIFWCGNLTGKIELLETLNGELGIHDLKRLSNLPQWRCYFRLYGRWQQ